MSWDHNLEDDTLAHTAWDSTVPSRTAMKPELEQHFGSHSPCAEAPWHSAGGHGTLKHHLSAWTAPPVFIVLSGCADTGFYHRATVFSGDQISCSNQQEGCCALHKAHFSKEKLWRASKVGRCLNMEAAQYLCTDTDLSVNLSLGKEEATTTC